MDIFGFGISTPSKEEEAAKLAENTKILKQKTIQAADMNIQLELAKKKLEESK